MFQNILKEGKNLLYDNFNWRRRQGYEPRRSW